MNRFIPTVWLCALVCCGESTPPQPHRVSADPLSNLVAQDLRVITRTANGYEEKNVLPVRFVPMTGKAQDNGP